MRDSEQTHGGAVYTEFRHSEVSPCEFPSSAEEGWPRHQKENGAATSDGADGVVLVKRMHDFLTITTPSARLRSLRGILTSRSHPSSAEEGSRSPKPFLLRTQTFLLLSTAVGCTRIPPHTGNWYVPDFPRSVYALLFPF